MMKLCNPLLICFLLVLGAPNLHAAAKEKIITVNGPKRSMIEPPTSPDLPLTLLSNSLRKNPKANTFLVYVGPQGGTRQLLYNRRRKFLMDSFYLLSKDFHTRWNNVSESLIHLISRAELDGNKVWRKKGEFQSTQIDYDRLLRKYGACLIKQSHSEA